MSGKLIKGKWNRIQIIVTSLGGFIGWFLGGLDGFLYALIILVVADYITGIMCAIVDKELSSEIGYRGIFKKLLIFILVGVGHMIDTNLIGDGSVLRTAVTFFHARKCFTLGFTNT